MKIKRYFAPDIRQAMRMVREEQGPDAVILSNRNVEGGVEVVAARDFGEDAGETESVPLQQTATRPADVREESFPNVDKDILREARRRAEQAFSELQNGGATPERIRPRSQPLNPTVTTPEFPRVSSPAESVQVRAHEPELKSGDKKLDALSGGFSALQAEIREMRQSLDQRLSEMAWQQAEQALPTRLDLLRYLGDRGFSKAICMEVAQRHGNHEQREQALQAARDSIARSLPVIDDTLLDYGGVVALVGPTGVGKTTTIAKLAARFRLQHGPRQIALVSLDNFRIAAHEQLNTYGRLLDVPVYTASSAEELNQVLSSLYDRRLVLIDTAGMGPRDMRLAEQFELLRESGVPLTSYLVLSAATQLASLRESMAAFRGFSPSACIWTKLDEVSQLGPAVSAVVEQRLPLAYYCDGQQVPEDLHRARTATVLEKCFAPILNNSEADSMGSASSFAEWMAQSNG